MKNEKEKQPERFGVGRGKFKIQVTGPNTCIVAIRRRSGLIEWHQTLPIEFATEFAKVETLEKKADSLRKGRDHWRDKANELGEKKIYWEELSGQYQEAITNLEESLSKVTEKWRLTDEELGHQLKKVEEIEEKYAELEEKVESLDVLLNASKEAQEYLKEEYASLSDGSKYLKERNEELTRQLQTSERNRKNTEEEKNDLEVKYESLLETIQSEHNNSKIYFWCSIAIILLMLAKILWV